MRLMSMLSCVVGVSIVGACSSEESKPAPAVEQAATVPEHFFTADRPADVPDLKAVRDGAAKGDQVTLLARVGGRVRPFTKGQASFVVTDPALLSCELKCEDGCKLPWDYCCEPSERLKLNVATIRLLENDMPIRTSAKGAGGLEELKYVVVTGTVFDINDDGLFVVDADTIWVGGKPQPDNPRLGSGG
ncbi:MAG: hypothetical protein MK074_07730 [Phycisphaerales bacterium]|nr:hypothetical protein [Phycisphaerales bacterium]